MLLRIKCSKQIFCGGYIYGSSAYGESDYEQHNSNLLEDKLSFNDFGYFDGDSSLFVSFQPLSKSIEKKILIIEKINDIEVKNIPHLTLKLNDMNDICVWWNIDPNIPEIQEIIKASENNEELTLELKWV